MITLKRVTHFASRKDQVSDGYNIVLDDVRAIASIFQVEDGDWVIADAPLQAVNKKTEYLFKSKTLKECKDEAINAHLLLD